MINTDDFIKCLKMNNFSPFIGVPCSYLKPLISCLELNYSKDYINAVNEGNAVSYAFGSALAGKKPIIVMQNSGIGNFINPYVTYIKLSKIPLLFIISIRNNDSGDTEQHDYMGANTKKILDDLGIENLDITDSFDLTTIHTIEKLQSQNKSVALLLKNKSFNFSKSKNKSGPHDFNRNFLPSYKEVFNFIKTTRNKSVYFCLGLGYISRSFYQELNDPSHCLFVVGAMGHTSNIAAGIASYTNKKIVAIEGDGSLLMHLENLAFIGNQNLSNFIHIIMDNGCYNSTGGQKTISKDVDLCSIANNCGYDKTYNVKSLNDFSIAYKYCLNNKGKYFIRVHTSKDIIPGKRPVITVSENTLSIKKILEE